MNSGLMQPVRPLQQNILLLCCCAVLKRRIASS